MGFPVEVKEAPPSQDDSCGDTGAEGRRKYRTDFRISAHGGICT
jgi:hypothetical protein